VDMNGVLIVKMRLDGLFVACQVGKSILIFELMFGRALIMALAAQCSGSGSSGISGTARRPQASSRSGGIQING